MIIIKKMSPSIQLFSIFFNSYTLEWRYGKKMEGAAEDCLSTGDIFSLKIRINSQTKGRGSCLTLRSHRYKQKANCSN